MVIKSGRMRWTGHVEHMGDMRNVHKVFVGKSDGKRPLRRPTEDNIRMGLQEIRWEGVGWVHLCQDRDQ
jgi:hypothetical protein